MVLQRLPLQNHFKIKAKNELEEKRYHIHNYHTAYSIFSDVFAFRGDAFYGVGRIAVS